MSVPRRPAFSRFFPSFHLLAQFRMCVCAVTIPVAFIARLYCVTGIMSIMQGPHSKDTIAIDDICATRVSLLALILFF